MADKSFADALNEQIANEFAASQQYVGAAVYYDAETLPRLASFFTGYGGAFRDQTGYLYFWIPIVGPIVGGLIGAGLYQALIGRFLPVATEPEPGRIPTPDREESVRG